MRFAAVIAALAITATALPATSLEQTGAALGMLFSHELPRPQKVLLTTLFQIRCSG